MTIHQCVTHVPGQRRYLCSRLLSEGAGAEVPALAGRFAPGGRDCVPSASGGR